MAELASDLWAAIAEYTNSGTVLLAVDEHSRRAAERFCPDQTLAVEREMFMSAGAEPSTSCTYYYDDTKGWEEIMLYRRYLDMEQLFRMFWWFHKSTIAVHVAFEGDWKKKAKSLPSIVDREGTTKNERTNHYVTWEVLQAFHKGNYGAVRLLFTDEVIDEEKMTITRPAHK